MTEMSFSAFSFAQQISNSANATDSHHASGFGVKLKSANLRLIDRRQYEIR
jgi:hypothetical protein